jgi:UDP-N-acetylmuramoyl-tripeptide--D-alanyl-D-alanine ligase
MKDAFKKIVIALLTIEARIAIWRHKPRIIAVTGNVGKTSTKDAIFSLVSQSFSARKSEKSFNSEIGLPLAILGLDTAWSSFFGWAENLSRGLWNALFGRNFPEFLVLEVGADHPGDIEKICSWFCPDITVLTRMADIPVHVEYFKDAAEVLREKMFLAKAVKTGGTIIVNSDDPHFMGALKEIDFKKVFYGTTPGANVEIEEMTVSYSGTTLPLPRGQRAVMRVGELEKKFEIYGVLGNHLMYPIAAACAVAVVLNKEEDIEKAFTNFVPSRGRMRILKGISTTAVIDDTYNSSPLAATEALKSLAGLSIRGRKIAVLGDMKELGGMAETAHREVGFFAGQSLHTLVTVGEAAKFIALGAMDAGLPPDRIYSFETSEEAAKGVCDLARAGDVMLVKGSQSMRMERVVKELLEDIFKAPDLLVRQEEEWEKR